MAENKQNSENKNTTESKATIGATSAKPAKDENAANKINNPTESAIGKDAPQSGNAANTDETLNKLKETVGDAAGQAVEQAKEKAGSVLDSQKTNLASGITGVADSIRQVGENLSSSNENNQIARFAGKYGDTLAQQVERFSQYVDEKEIREIARDVEQFARRNPIVFVGGAFALGILAARFLKSSANQSANRRARGNRSDD